MNASLSRTATGSVMRLLIHVELEIRRADDDHVTRLEAGVRDPAAVDTDAVRRVQVDEVPVRAPELQLEMPARYVRVREHVVATLAAADHSPVPVDDEALAVRNQQSTADRLLGNALPILHLTPRAGGRIDHRRPQVPLG